MVHTPIQLHHYKENKLCLDNLSNVIERSQNIVKDIVFPLDNFFSDDVIYIQNIKILQGKFYEGAIETKYFIEAIK